MSGKQDVISDLSTIRSGAAKGATAYQKPADGIPYADLSDAVNNGIQEGVTANQIASTIEGLIPAQASEDNKLADKDFVNSSISTATATFKGTYNSVAELEQVTADANDYAFVISTDSAGNTVYNRYKYSNGSWLFEYALNNSSFTAAQWAAINSAITSGDVQKLAALPTQAQLSTLLAAKVDKVIGKGLSTNDFTNTEKEKLSSLKEWTSEIVYNFQFPDAGTDLEPPGEPIEPTDHKIIYVNTTVLGGDSKYFYIMPQFADVGKLKESIYIIKPSLDTKVGYGPSKEVMIIDSDELLLAGGQYNVVKVTWCLTEDYDPEQPVSGAGYVNITVSTDWKTLINALQGIINNKQNTLTWDTVPTLNSANPVTSGGIYTALDMTALTDQEIEDLMPEEETEESPVDGNELE